MKWEQRLREMIVAGGAAAATACTGSTSTSPSDASGTQDVRSSDANEEMPFVGGGCCNANGDPCCEYLHCGGSLTPECSEEMACQAEGGTFVYLTNDAGCSFAHDGGTSDAGVTDAAPDGVSVDAPADTGAGADAHPD
jgi:hypothetical protein